MIVNRLKDILKANINAQWEKISDQEFLDDWKKYFDEDSSSTYSEDNFKSDEEEWERYQQQKNSQQNSEREKENAYYADLELQPGADFPTLKKAYRRMVKLYHPDLFQHDSKKQEIAKEVTRKINEAYNYFEKKFGK